MVDLDSETLFDVASAAIATIAAVVFIVNVEFPYSPVTKLALVLAFLAGVVALTQRTDDQRQTVLGYGVVVVTTVALFFETVGTFDAGNTVTVVGLLVLAGLSFYLRTRLNDRNRFISGERATALFAAVAVVAVAVLVVDVATGGLAYELQPERSVEIPGGDRRDELLVATVVVHNPTPLPERVEVPRYRACTAGNWSEYRPPSEPGQEERRVHVDVNVQDGYNEFVFGFATRQFPVQLYLNGRNLTGQEFPVQVTERCPDDESGRAYIALFEAPRRVYGRPV